MTLDRVKQRAMDLANRPKIRVSVLIGALVLILYALVGFFALPPLAESIAEKQIRAALNRRAVIDAIHFNPFTLEARVRGFKLMAPQGEAVFVSFDQLLVNVQIRSLWHLGPVLSELRLTRPYIHLKRLDAQRFNVSDLIGRPGPAPDKPEKPMAFAVDNLVVEGGHLVFEDGLCKTTHEIADLTVVVPAVSNLPAATENWIEAVVAASVNDATVTVSAKARPFGEKVEAAVDMAVRGVNLPRYLAYLPFKPAFALPSGRLDMNLGVQLERQGKKDPAIQAKAALILKDVSLTDLAGVPLVKWDTLDLSLDRADVNARTAAIGHAVVTGLEAKIVRLADGRINIVDLVPSGQGPAPAPVTKPQPGPATANGSAPLPPATPAFSLTMDRIRVQGARLHFTDQTLPQPFTVTVAPLDIEVRHLTLPTGPPAEVAITARADGGEHLALNATVTPQPLTADGRLVFAGLGLERFAPYYADALNARIEGGVLSGEAAATIAPGDDQRQVQIKGISGILENFVVRLPKAGGGAPLLTIGRLSMADGTVDPAARKIRIGEIAWHQGHVAIARDQNGAIDALGIVAAPATPPAGPSPELPAANPWDLALKKFHIEDVGISLEDRQPPEPVKLTVDKVRLTLDNVSNTAGAKAGLALQALVNGKGKVSVTGSLGVLPLAANLDVACKGIDLVALKPYLADRLGADVASAVVGTTGHLAISRPAGQPLSGTWRGNLDIGPFALRDRTTGRNLVTWKTLYWDGIDVQLAPLRLDVAKVALSDFDARLYLSPEGRLNIKDIVAAAPGGAAAEGSPVLEGKPSPAAPPPPDTAKPATVSPAALPPVTVKTITVQGGRVNFTDHYIKPNYRADLVNLDGKISGLSTDPASRAELNLRGQVNHAPLTIAGTLNPLAKDLVLDIKADVKGMDLAPLTPYSGKYVGYGIEKGKLSFAVGYKVADGQLSATNRLVLDQLTFGEKIESPTATKLPVMLAVSLLKDANGMIDINLPISGSLDDPQFSIGAILLKVIGNLITKAITAPFALLGSLVGGGGDKDLSVVVFEPGQDSLTDQARAKLEDLAKALAQRPGLSVEIAGRADPAVDTQGLALRQVRRKVTHLKREALARKDPGADLSAVRVTDEDYPEWLEKAYRREDFPKPRNLIGLTKSLPVEQMEEMMVAHAKVNDQALAELANRRAQRVKNWLVETQGADAERLFLLAPRVGPAPDREKTGADAKTPASRVEFAIKG